MTTDREILQNYRDDLEHRIKDLFIWALGESAITRETHETAEDVWTRILLVEKNGEFENVTPAEPTASKFMSVIGRSAGDYELKKKIRKSDMTIGTITALVHEHMYDCLNDSNNSKEIKNVQERQYKRKWTDKSDTDRTKKRPEYQKQKPKGAPNWSRLHFCPAKTPDC